MNLRNQSVTRHKPDVNVAAMMRNYKDQYDDHTSGLLQENTQNSFDAYSKDVHPRDMKIVIKYDADNRILTWQDFNTNGMPHCNKCDWGEIEINGKIDCCKNPECAWGAYHKLGWSVKEDGSIGSRGMGKSLQILAGKKTIIRTMLTSEECAASLWEQNQAGDWTWQKSDDDIEVLSVPGTKIETHGIIKSVHDKLLDIDFVRQELQSKWFRLLDQNATITYVITGGGKKHVVNIHAPTWPAVERFENGEKAQIITDNAVVKYDDINVTLHNLTVCVAKEPFNGDDYRYGIAIVKNGKQTIQKITDFPDLPTNLSRRIYGWCDADASLEIAENSSHNGYQANHPAFKAVRRKLREHVKDFVAPFIKVDRITDKDVRDAREIGDIFNRVLKNIPSLHLTSMVKKSANGNSLPSIETSKNYLYLSRIEIQNRKYNRGEAVPVNIVIKNPTDKEQLVRCVLEYYDSTPVLVASHEISEVVPRGTTENPGTRVFPCQFKLDKIAPGVHQLKVKLLRTKWDAYIDDKGKAIEKMHYIFCEEDPPEIRRQRQALGDGPTKFIIQMNDMPEDMEASIDVDLGIIHINRKGYRVKYADDNSKNRKAYLATVADLATEQIRGEKIREVLYNNETWLPSEIDVIIKDIDKFVIQMNKDIRKELSD